MPTRRAIDVLVIVLVASTCHAAYAICLPDLVLSGTTVSTPRTFSSCDSITAGSGFTITATGDAVLEAGSQIVINDGFQVDAGGRLTARIVPAPQAERLSLTEISAEVGIEPDYYEGSTTHGLGVNWIDYDQDGWPDLFTTNGFGLDPHLYHNLGNGTFSKVDELLPELPDVEMAGSVFGDYDNDGDLDIFIQVTNEQWELYGFNLPDGPTDILLKNLWAENGGRVVDGEPLFEDVASIAGVDGTLVEPWGDYPAWRSMTGGWLDADRDGCLDLYVGRNVNNSAGHAANFDTLYRNNCDGSGSFADETAERGLYDGTDPATLRPALAFLAGHLDEDLWTDIYVVNMATNTGIGQDHRDILYLNDGDGTFTEASAASPGLCDDAGAGMGIDTADLDLDGDWDLYISDVLGDDWDTPPPGNVLYLSNGDGTWQDNSAPEAGLVAAGDYLSGSWSVNFLDVDHDGYEDLLVGFRLRKVLFINDRAGAFVPLTTSVGLSDAFRTRGAASADFDRDGDLDVAAIHQRGELELYRNDGSESANWLEVRLVGSTSNRAAIGAVVELSTNGLTMMRQVKGGSSTHSQDDLVLHFGLAESSIVEQLTIRWPSGLVETHEGITGNRLLQCREGDGVCTVWSP